MLLEMDRNPGFVGLDNSTGMRTASTVMISSVFSRVDRGSTGLAPRSAQSLPDRHEASWELRELIEMRVNPGGTTEVLFRAEGFERFLNVWIMSEVIGWSRSPCTTCDFHQY
jgi:hypothetical protein